MKTSAFRIRLNVQALRDIEESVDWDLRNWGEEQTRRWAKELYKTIDDRLGSFPLSCPIAPESIELGVEVRQLIFSRYRVLFTIENEDVLVLYLRGPFRLEQGFE